MDRYREQAREILNTVNRVIYGKEELTEKKHNYELEKAGCAVVCIDYKMSGVGSNSCGPELLEQYRFDEEEFQWEMLYTFGDRN